MPFPRSRVLTLLFLAAACKPAASADPASEARALVPTPLDGLWRQASVTCADGRVPTEKVEELDFGDAGFFSVTYAPFETYKDYWGKAKFDLARGDIAFTVEHGNFVPPGLDLEGKVRLEGGELTISEVWFGDRAPGAPSAAACTYVFRRPSAA